MAWWRGGRGGVASLEVEQLIRSEASDGGGERCRLGVLLKMMPVDGGEERGHAEGEGQAEGEGARPGLPRPKHHH